MIKQLAQKDDKIPRVGIPDESRNALKMVVLRHQDTASGAEGRVIVLYFPFRQTSPISANEGCTRLWKSEIHFDGIFEGLGVQPRNRNLHSGAHEADP
jgi:hypothetical protein